MMVYNVKRDLEITQFVVRKTFDNIELE